MTTFAEHVDDYLRLRRALGFKLEEHARLLPRFAAHLDAIGAEVVTIDLALAWAVAPVVPAGSVVPAMRLLVVRGFARYLAGIDPRTEVPPTGLIRLRRHRRPPFIYTDEQVLALMQRARTAIRQSLVAATYETLIGLLAATGMRISEAIKLDNTDVDWQQGVLLVRESKFNKSRYLPVHASTLDALERYTHQRARLCPNPLDQSFFVSLRRRRLDDCAVHATFRRLCDATGVGAEAPFPPRLHDLRHTMAVRTLLGWYREGVDVQSRLPALSTYLGHLNPAYTYYYLSARTTAARARRRDARRHPGGPAMTLIAPTLQAFFTDRLTKQLHASPRTIASYRDSLRLLLCFANDRTAIAPAALDWDDLDEPLITAFLDHLETDRHNSPRTRNLRLTAIRALLRYAALRHPEHAAVIARVLSIPAKRFDRRIVTFLTAKESVALIDAAPGSRWEGRRDRAMLTLAIHAGLRVSELIAVNCADIELGTGAHVRVEGKGRKQRAVPLTKDAQAVLAVWLDERAGRSDDPLFPTCTGRRLTRDAVERRVATHAATAAQRCPSLAAKRVHPHVLRHSCAMSLLQARVDSTVIALWLGHADTGSTQQYIHADMTIKERALALLTPPTATPGRYTPTDEVLAYLDSLG